MLAVDFAAGVIRRDTGQSFATRAADTALSLDDIAAQRRRRCA